MAHSSDLMFQKAIGFHQQGQWDKAEKLYRKILSRDPRHAEAVHMRGVLKLQTNKHEHAKQLLAKAAKLNPGNALISFHQGELYQSLAEHSEAEVHFREALSLGSDEADVYFMLGNALFDLLRFSEAAENYKSALERSPNDHDCRLNLANALEASGELEQAIEHLTLLVKLDNNCVALKLQLISLLARFGDFLQVERQIQDIVGFSISDIQSLAQAIKTLIEADRSELASRLLDKTLYQSEFSVVNASLDTSLIEQLTDYLINLGRYQDARLFLELQSPDSASGARQQSAIALFQLGLCEQVAGNFDKAARSHQLALNADNTLGRAAYSLAINGCSEVSENDLTDWQRQADNTELSTEQRSQFLFSIARVRDKQHHIDDAFAAYREANKLQSESNPFDADAWDRYIDGIIKNFSAAYFDRVKGIGQGGDDLVFIIGMPRSGSTLLEYNLTQNMGACGLGEHPTMRRLFMDLPLITGQQLRAFECADFIEQEQSDYLRQEYLQSLPATRSAENQSAVSIIRNEPTPYYVDKMLGNFLRLGIIAAMFPHAKILHCARDPRACCVSCYTNLFARGLRFTYDLYGLGRAWKSYDKLMQHWQAVLPLQMYEVSYEKVVTHPEKIFSDIADFLDRQYSVDAQLDKHAGPDISTASFFQARQAISTSSLDAWRRFDANLEPLYRGLS